MKIRKISEGPKRIMKTANIHVMSRDGGFWDKEYFIDSCHEPR